MLDFGFVLGIFLLYFNICFIDNVLLLVISIASPFEVTPGYRRWDNKLIN